MRRGKGYENYCFQSLFLRVDAFAVRLEWRTLEIVENSIKLPSRYDLPGWRPLVEHLLQIED